MLARLAFLALISTLVGCVVAERNTLRIEGRLDGPAAGTLPQPAEWVVELRDDSSGSVLAEQRGTVTGAQPPIPFVLKIDAARIDPAHRHSLRGAVSVQGVVRWLSVPLPVSPRQARTESGSLRLQPYTWPGAFASLLDCGGRQLVAGYVGQRLRLSEGTRIVDLEAVAGSRPARFQQAGDLGSFVQIDGDRTATVSLQGTLLPPCSAQALPE
ncbi:MAG TPA: YbaY family lipoprotein [Rubrivivax sp.]|nr:YbaY family lipoprotein [Rubrivivax sp.]